jgi:hypothetical protein
MLEGDRRTEAVEASERFRDLGISQYWDDQHLLGHEIAGSLGVKGWVAWDVYLFYRPGVEWGDQGLPPPDAALAQAGGVVVATPGTLPALADQSALLKQMQGQLQVVGQQENLEALLKQVAEEITQRKPRS